MSTLKQSFLKCQKCRRKLFNKDNNTLINAHSNLIESNEENSCDSLSDRSLVFLKEDTLPDWIKAKVELEQWMKGKLHCEDCGCKIGSFDFVSGRKCACGEFVLPPVHFIRSQIDISVPVNR